MDNNSEIVREFTYFTKPKSFKSSNLKDLPTLRLGRASAPLIRHPSLHPKKALHKSCAWLLLAHLCCDNHESLQNLFQTSRSQMFFISHSLPFDFSHNVASERPDKNISSALLAFAFWACLHSTAGPSLMRSLFRPSSTLSEDNGTRGVFLFHQEKVWKIEWSSIQLIFDSHHFTFESHKDFNHFPWVTVLHQYFWNTRWIAFLSWRLPFDNCIPWPWQSKMPGIYYDLAAHFCDLKSIDSLVK